MSLDMHANDAHPLNADDILFFAMVFGFAAYSAHWRILGSMVTTQIVMQWAWMKDPMLMQNQSIDDFKCICWLQEPDSEL